jgi:hypothetical protein
MTPRPERCGIAHPPAWPACLLGAALALAGCSKLHRTDLKPLDQAGMYFNNVEQLRQLGVSDAEVAQLVPARQAGVPDEACVELIRIARARHQPFADGQAVASLVSAGVRQDSVLELARLNQLGLWSGEAEALRLSGLSDQVVLAVARRRAAGQPSLSSPKIAALKNAGFNETQILADINNGVSDAQADRIIAERNYANGGHTFVSERRRRR